jgi:hypothetical protein
MKKILMILGLVLLVSSVVFANYDSTTGTYEINLKEGWNLVPIGTGTPPTIANELSDSERSECYYLNNNTGWHQKYPQQYFYDASQKKYIGSPSLTIVADSQNSVNGLITGAAWVHSNGNCKTWTTAGKKNTLPSIETNQKYAKLIQGWNFLAINPYMLGVKNNYLFSNCSLTGFNFWDSENQKWFYPSSSQEAQYRKNLENEFREEDIGIVMVVKVANDCYLNYGSTATGPPSLPN